MNSPIASVLIVVGVFAWVASSQAQKDNRSIAEGILLAADILAYSDVCKEKIGDISGDDGSKIMNRSRELGFDIHNDKHVLLVAQQRRERAMAFEIDTGKCWAVRDSFHDIAASVKD